MKLKTNTKRVRDALADIDYLDRLPEQARAWMEVYLRATLTLEDAAISLLEAEHPSLRKTIYDEDRAQRRDVTFVGLRVEMDDLLAGGVAPGNCPHCYKAKCMCGPRKRHARYSQVDYLNK